MLDSMTAANCSDIDPATLDRSALRLPADAHKGLRGSVGILGGAAGMVGAAWLAGRAALHGGAGRVYIGQIDPAAPAVDPLYPELMLRRAEALFADDLPLTALVVGPGMGAAPPAADLLVQAMAAPVPLLLDADALNLIAARADLRQRLLQRAKGGVATVITPHPAEAARLLNTMVEAVQADRRAAARALVERCQCVTVLKGAGTLVAWPVSAPPGTSVSGSGTSLGIALVRNSTGSNRLATAGTGDVLSGLIGALLARGLDAPTAAQLGVWVHGQAGEQLPDQRPTASGLLPLIAGLARGG
ncbi:NAD(P)H-hydrate dehydratase [bacterium]|nr:NAD(P)H-hydrate dehydratase [bacterium]